MNLDMKIIKELEKEIDRKLPWMGMVKDDPTDESDIVERMFQTVDVGFHTDENDNVIGLALVGLNLKQIPYSLFKLTNLQAVYLGHNQIIDIPRKIKSLTQLRIIQLSDNNISEIKPFLLDLGIPITRNGEGITLEKNPLTIPPGEIVDQGNEAIRNYFSQIKQAKGKTLHLFEAKLLIIGDGGTGKTSFKRKIMDANAKMPKARDTTLGIAVDQWSYRIRFSKFPDLGEALFHVNLWDFGGQKIYRGTHQIFFSDKSFYVLVADTREQGTDFSYWLNTVLQLAGEDSGILILLNKKYGHEAKFDETGFRSHFGRIIKDVFELDLKK